MDYYLQYLQHKSVQSRKATVWAQWDVASLSERTVFPRSASNAPSMKARGSLVLGALPSSIYSCTRRHRKPFWNQRQKFELRTESALAVYPLLTLMPKSGTPISSYVQMCFRSRLTNKRTCGWRVHWAFWDRPTAYHVNLVYKMRLSIWTCVKILHRRRKRYPCTHALSLSTSFLFHPNADRLKFNPHFSLEKRPGYFIVHNVRRRINSLTLLLSKEWSIPNFPCSLTKNITWHSIRNWLAILTTSLIYISLSRVERMYFLPVPCQSWNADCADQGPNSLKIIPPNRTVATTD